MKRNLKLKINTHLRINKELCGSAVSIGDNRSIVECRLTDSMTVDEKGLIHGGFIFGIADYAAMLAVNHENVVLASSSCKFLKPSRKEDLIRAEARVTEQQGKKFYIEVNIFSNNSITFSGSFMAVIPKNHVLTESQ